jgi:hypothetical protein
LAASARPPENYPYCNALDADEAIVSLRHGASSFSPAELADTCAFLRDCGVLARVGCAALQCTNSEYSHWVYVGRHLHTDVKHLLHAQKITMGHARAIARVDANKQLATAQDAIRFKRSVRDLEFLVRGADPRLSAEEIAYYDRLADNISERIGHEFKVNPDADNKRAGYVTIRYESLEMFEAVCERLQIDLAEIS